MMMISSDGQQLLLYLQRIVLLSDFDAIGNFHFQNLISISSLQKKLHACL